MKTFILAFSLLILAACGSAPPPDASLGHPGSTTAPKCVQVTQCDVNTQACVLYMQATATQCDLLLVEIGTTPVFPPLN